MSFEQDVFTAPSPLQTAWTLVGNLAASELVPQLCHLDAISSDPVSGDCKTLATWVECKLVAGQQVWARALKTPAPTNVLVRVIRPVLDAPPTP